MRIQEPHDTTSVYSGTAQFEAVAFDPDVGAQNGDGVAAVEFQLFGGNGENPVVTSGPLTAPPYQWILDTTAWPDSGYSLVVRATSTVAAGGHFNSTGGFLIIDNQP